MRALLISLALAGFASTGWAAPPEVPPTEIYDGTLTVAELKPWFDRGPQPLVAAVRVRPALVKGRFVGFRITRFIDPQLAANPAIRVGDVLTRVNGLAIERPEQFMKAWAAARGAKTLKIEVLRGTAKLLFQWKIVP